MASSPQRTVVDCMNVIGSRADGWWRDRDRAVLGLLQQLQRLSPRAGGRLTLVVDGRQVEGAPEGDNSGVEVLYARRMGRDGADDRIVEEVEKEREGVCTVVTSDRELRARVRVLGARTLGPSSLLGRIDRL